MTNDHPDPADPAPVDTDPPTCASCGAALPEGAAFCMACGTPVTAEVSIAVESATEASGGGRCAACGEPLPGHAAFCTACGAPAPGAAAPVPAVPVPPPPRRSAWMPGWLWWLLGIVIVAGAGAGGFFGYRMLEEEPAVTPSSATVDYLGEAPAAPGAEAVAATSPTTTLPNGMVEVPYVGWMTFDEAAEIASAAGFTLREGADYPVASGDPRIGLVARTAPGAGAPASTAEPLWAELAVDGGAEVRIHPGDLGVIPACTAVGGTLPEGVALGIGGERLACGGQVEVAADTRFFIRAWWVQPSWPDPDLDRVAFTLDGAVQPVECTASWSAGSVAGSCVMTHRGIPAGSHEIVATSIIGGEIMLTSAVAVVATG